MEDGERGRLGIGELDGTEVDKSKGRRLGREKERGQ